MHYYLLTTYNHRSYIEACLASVAAQYADADEFQAQARLLLLDDASSDATVETVRALAERYPNLQWRQNRSNHGIGHNRNLLLRWWRGLDPQAADVVMFVDGDDLLTADSLGTRLQVLAGDTALDAVGGQLGLFNDADGQRLRPVTSFACDPQILAIANIYECHFYVANALYRARALLAAEVLFPRTAASEDWLFFNQHPIRKRHIDAITLKYRRHDSNLTNHNSGAGQRAQIQRLRSQARRLALAPIGYRPSARDNQLLDLIGYLSLKLVWREQGPLYCLGIHMPWFRLLADQPEIQRSWPRLQEEIAGLHARLIEHNHRQPHFHPAKLQRYTQAMLAAATHEVHPGAASFSVAN